MTMSFPATDAFGLHAGHSPPVMRSSQLDGKATLVPWAEGKVVTWRV